MEFQRILRHMTVLMASICFSVGLGGCDMTPLEIPEDPERQKAVQESAALPASLTISNVVARSGRSYTVHDNLQVGDRRYIDRDFTFTAIPQAFVGQTYIRTANEDRTSYPSDTTLLSFHVNVDVDVYVADSDRTKRPAWLKGWTDTGSELRDNNNPETKYSLFKKRFPPGNITLGSNYWGDGANMYTVLVVPVAAPADETGDDSLNSGTIPAFPGAEGFGATALQRCRSLPLEVLTVSNLDDGGPGSLRHALENARNDRFSVIVFRTGGYINLNTRIEVRDEHCLYVAGQTAPGDGITIRGWNGLRFRGTNEDIVLRHFRVRLGEGGKPTGTHGVYFDEGNRVIFGHLSSSWAEEKLITISAVAPDSVVNFTVQRTIMSEVLAAHPTAMQVTGEPRADPPNRYISIHRNLFSGNAYRNPAIASHNAHFVNNVIYNWLQGASHQDSHLNFTRADYVNNFYKIGPLTRAAYQYEVTVQCHAEPGLISWYVSGNVGPHNQDPDANSVEQWTGANRVTACYYKTGSGPGVPVPGSLNAARHTRLAKPSLFAPIELDAFTAEADVLADVGANRMLTCTGAMVFRQDAVDIRILNEYSLGTGVGPAVPVSEADVGGFPILDSGTPCGDSDEDGLPDAWEALYPGAADPPSDADGDGYLNIEEFLNGTVPN